MSDDSAEAGFLTRWSRRKAALRQGQTDPERSAPAPPAPSATPKPAGEAGTAMPPTTIAPAPPTQPAPPAAEPAPTLADVAELTRESDFKRFVAPGVDTEVKNAALKKLFGDPQFNLMDGLDTYIDDYGKPDPLPEGMLRQMVQSRFLGLFTEEQDPGHEREAATVPTVAADTPPVASGQQAPPTESVTHEDPDLRLQSHDAVGRAGLKPGVAPDTGCER